MPCHICPGCATVWMATDLTGGNITWVRLIHVDGWTMTPNRQEANKKRTSDTGGAAVKFCSDIVDWTFEVTNTLCIDDWLYADILDDSSNPSVGVTTWFFFGWGCEHSPVGLGAENNVPPDVVTTAALDPSTFAAADSGIYAYGTVNPPGFGVVNDGSDPATADWSLSVTVGPLMPVAALTGASGPYSGSDSILQAADEAVT